MNQKFFLGISEIKKDMPKAIQWVLVSGAAIMAALYGVNHLYPIIVTTDLITNVGKLMTLASIIAPFLGVSNPAQSIDEKKTTYQYPNP